MGLARKLKELQSLRPDIAILSEVACSQVLQKSAEELAALPMVWVGKNPNKGLAVVSFTGSALVLDSSYRDSNQYVAPVHVNGKGRFDCLQYGTTTTARRA